MSSASRRDNQRLEFLGDRVLGLVISDALLKADEEASEGLLAPRFNALVRKDCCAEVAEEIDLGAVIKLGRSEMLSGGRRKKTLLGDAIEAVIAAVFLDGGFEAAQKVVLRHWSARIAGVKALARDPKTELQEWAQSCGFSPPTYTLISRAGPDHQPVFVIEARLENGLFVQATAGNKREAEKVAATALLQQIKDRKK
jgi:ribonuclease-3|tara:strand:+ start:219 stop:812 length:594 start_codon:yes stop_codon:yes gene_type:complete